MALLKSNQVDAFINNPDFSKPVILIYGPDEGLVSERADKLAEKSGVDLSDPFCLIRLNADDVAGDTSRLASEAHTIGMFGGKRLIRISGTTRKDLMKSIKLVLETPPEDAMILIEAGDLKKSSGLRKNLEANSQSLCIPCYQDTEAALQQLINEELIQKGINIDRETRAELTSMLGENRMVSRGELRKLAIFCEGKQEVTRDDVYSIVGEASKLVVDDVIDATATGDVQRLQQILPKALESGMSPDMTIQVMLRYFQMLQSARFQMEHKRKPVGAIVSGLRPPVHFSRKASVSNAISIWPLNRIGKALSRLDKAMFECRSNSALASSLAGTAFLALALEAASLKRRN